MSKVTKIAYAVINEIAIESVKQEFIRLEVEVAEDDDLDKIVEDLRNTAMDLCELRGEYEEYKNLKERLTRQIMRVDKINEKCRKNYETIAKFLLSLGIDMNPDAFSKLPLEAIEKLLEDELDNLPY